MKITIILATMAQGRLLNFCVLDFPVLSLKVKLK